MLGISMQQDKTKINLRGVSQTLLSPLWARAKLSREHNSVLNDMKAIEIVEHIDYDFSTLDKKLNLESNLVFVTRARQFDDKIRAYIAEYPHASVINLGAGLDTTFHRVDNGSIHWYDLDLPDVIELRKQLVPETDRMRCVAKSLLDLRWRNDVEDIENGVFIISCGVLGFFEKSQVKQFFSSLADNFPGGELVFDTASKLGNLMSNFGLRQTGIKNATTKWTLKDANKLKKWDKRIIVIDQFPYFKNIPRDPAWGVQIKRWMDLMDKSGMFNIFHVRV
jgi:O-methyltransferase involved in polyketide biosynthesis